MAATELPASLPPRAAPPILVIEDDPMMLDMLCAVFSTAGYIPLPAASGAAGLACLEHERVDLVVLDLHLPDMDGWDVSSHIRDRSPVSPPILILTGSTRVHGATISFQLEADAYLTKPIDVNELLARVEALLRRTRSVLQ